LVAVLNDWARQESATDYEALPSERRAALRDRLTSMIRANTYDAGTSRVTISPEISIRSTCPRAAHEPSTSDRSDHGQQHLEPLRCHDGVWLIRRHQLDIARRHGERHARD